MKKSKYIRPVVDVCNVETSQMMAASKALHRFDAPADMSDVLVNENDFTDIWGN